VGVITLKQAESIIDAVLARARKLECRPIVALYRLTRLTRIPATTQRERPAK